MQKQQFSIFICFKDICFFVVHNKNNKMSKLATPCVSELTVYLAPSAGLSHANDITMVCRKNQQLWFLHRRHDNLQKYQQKKI